MTHSCTLCTVTRNLSYLQKKPGLTKIYKREVHNTCTHTVRCVYTYTHILHGTIYVAQYTYIVIKQHDIARALYIYRQYVLDNVTLHTYGTYTYTTMQAKHYTFLYTCLRIACICFVLTLLMIQAYFRKGIVLCYRDTFCQYIICFPGTIVSITLTYVRVCNVQTLHLCTLHLSWEAQHAQRSTNKKSNMIKYNFHTLSHNIYYTVYTIHIKMHYR